MAAAPFEAVDGGAEDETLGVADFGDGGEDFFTDLRVVTREVEHGDGGCGVGWVAIAGSDTSVVVCGADGEDGAWRRGERLKVRRRCPRGWAGSAAEDGASVG